MTNSPKPLSAFTSAAAGVLQSLPAGLQVVLRNPSLFRLSAAELDDRRVLMVALQERLSLEEAELGTEEIADQLRLMPRPFAITCQRTSATTTAAGQEDATPAASAAESVRGC